MVEKGTAKAYRCTAPSTGGSNYIIGQIAAGEFRLGVAQSDWQYQAVNGSSKMGGAQFTIQSCVFSSYEPFQINRKSKDQRLLSRKSCKYW